MKKRSLESRFSTSLLTLTALVLFVAMIINSITQYFFIEKGSREDRGHLLAVVESATANSLWNYNLADAQSNAEALFNRPDVVMVQILDDRQREMYYQQKEGPEVSTWFLNRIERNLYKNDHLTGVMVVVFSNYSIYRNISIWLFIQLFSGLLLVGLMMLFLRSISHHLTQDLHAMIASSKRLAVGQFDEVITVDVTDEVGELATSLNEMAVQLQTAFNHLRQSEDRYRTIFNSTTNAILIRDAESGEILEANQAAETLLGYSLAELKVLPVRELMLHHNNLSILQNGNAIPSIARDDPQTFKWQLRKKDGTPIWVETTLSLTDLNQRRCILMVGRDITEQTQTAELIQAQNEQLLQKNQALTNQRLALQKAEEELRQLNLGLENRVRERTAALETINRELENFSYSISHDLRTPLRAINGFSQILMDEYADQLNAEMRHALERIRAASNHMAALINDLLDLSRVIRSDMNLTSFNLSLLASAVFTELIAQQPERNVDFILCPSIPVRADPALMRIVLNNLLDNALKFTSTHARARIEVGVKQQEGKTVYFIADDGEGFDQEYAGKLFGPFQRLHGIEEFEGTGMGLTLVQRIIQRHNGEIWAEGKTGAGATFFFTLKP